MASFAMVVGFNPQKLLCKFIDTLCLSDLLYINMYDSVSYVFNRSVLSSELTQPNLYNSGTPYLVHCNVTFSVKWFRNSFITLFKLFVSKSVASSFL